MWGADAATDLWAPYEIQVDVEGFPLSCLAPRAEVLHGKKVRHGGHAEHSGSVGLVSAGGRMIIHAPVPAEPLTVGVPDPKTRAGVRLDAIVRTTLPRAERTSSASSPRLASAPSAAMKLS